METLEALNITAKEVKAIIAEIPAEQFITSYYEHQGKCCVLGHIERIKNHDGRYNDRISCTADDTTRLFRTRTKEFLLEIHGVRDNIADVNNWPNTNGYTESVIKDRVMHFLDDMEVWEESKKN